MRFDRKDLFAWLLVVAVLWIFVMGSIRGGMSDSVQDYVYNLLSVMLGYIVGNQK